VIRIVNDAQIADWYIGEVEHLHDTAAALPPPSTQAATQAAAAAAAASGGGGAVAGGAAAKMRRPLLERGRVPANYVAEVVCETAALFAYSPRASEVAQGQLSFQRDELIYIYKKHDDDWWDGCTRGGKKGTCPANHLRVLG
jgi:hypothetical protein